MLLGGIKNCELAVCQIFSRCFLREFASSPSTWVKRGKRIPPKNFAEVYLKGTTQFIQRQLSDPYVKKRRLENYRCRSAFKLMEIDDKHKIIKPGAVVVDLGAAPGSWSQVTQDRIDGDAGGVIVAVDLLYFPPLDGVHSIMGDFTTKETRDKIENIVKNVTNSTKADLVLCDAAPKASGVKGFDHSVIISLASSAATYAINNLKEHGTFLFKLYSGDKSGLLVKNIRPFFEDVKSVKPDASRKESAEFYVLCTGYKFPGRKENI